ncbi:hypothetical protein JTE90_007032 [Oedothorax gibbosus]|uniref:Uncharacterized protein n=1 Tax=Oedothorax gibbosus TaxID=931172 RepID=A0AAV6U720_9ARAC|nr:hypothetical protein JTE90_007032 [Oedothorax gibbosus]
MKKSRSSGEGPLVLPASDDDLKHCGSSRGQGPCIREIRAGPICLDYKLPPATLLSRVEKMMGLIHCSEEVFFGHQIRTCPLPALSHFPALGSSQKEPGTPGVIKRALRRPNRSDNDASTLPYTCLDVANFWPPFPYTHAGPDRHTSRMTYNFEEYRTTVLQVCLTEIAIKQIVGLQKKWRILSCVADSF